MANAGSSRILIEMIYVFFPFFEDPKGFIVETRFFFHSFSSEHKGSRIAIKT